MSSSGQNLPRFHNSPVVETVLGIHFPASEDAAPSQREILWEHHCRQKDNLSKENRGLGGWSRDMESQLDAIIALPAGWDSYGAPRPNPNCVEAGRELLDCLARASEIPKPFVNPTPSGGVQFEWESGDRYFELEVVSEREAVYLYCDGAAHTEETGRVFAGESLTPVLAFICKAASLQ